MKRPQAFRRVAKMLGMLGVLLVTLVGCGTTPSSKFYMLESLSMVRALEPVGVLDPAMSVGLGPVVFPDYLDRPQIVTRTQQNGVQLAEYDRWAGSLSSNVSRIVAEDLTFLLHTDSVVQYPWPASFDVTYQVLIDCYRFDGVLGGKALLDVQWSVLGKKGRKVLLLKRSTFSEPAAGVSYEALVAAQSRALGSLSREIALALKDLAQDKAQE
jgi:uncharacterized protein